jgi:hypothetical protein
MDQKIISELRAAINEEQAEAQNAKAFEACAKLAKGMYAAYISAGFTEGQALYLTATVLTSSARKS